MSILIDKMFKDGAMNDTQEFDGRWFMAKPLSIGFSWLRVSDAIRVLRDKSRAIHYKIDEEHNNDRR